MAQINYTVRERTIKQISIARIIECAQECLAERTKKMGRTDPIGLCLNYINGIANANELLTIEYANHILERLVDESMENLWYTL